MKAGGPTRTVLVLLCMLLLLTTNQVAASEEQSQQTTSAENYIPTSWALGVVVPEGAALEEGGSLHWGHVTNVTATVVLPNIKFPDRIVYALVSVMTADESVLQVGVGIYPGSGTWLVYSNLVTNVWSAPPTYKWILNASGPQMAPNSSVLISIYRPRAGPWSLRVLETGTGSSVDKTFPTGIAPSLKAGDQEVFAFESYSRSASTFRDMGNLTLESLLVDGESVSGGFYSYGDWDSVHNPLFAVGSTGSALPDFISFRLGGDCAAVWGYRSGWQTNDGAISGWLSTDVLVVSLSFSLVAVALIAVLITRVRRRRRDSSADVSSSQPSGPRA